MVVELKDLTADKLKELLRDPVYFPALYLDKYPHEGQIEILRDPTKNKVICCGRRAGKTEMIAFEIIRGAFTGDFKRQMVVAPTYRQSKIVFDKIIVVLNMAKKTRIIRKQVKSPHPQIQIENGTDMPSIVDFCSTDRPDTIRGDNYDRLFQDEGNFIKDEAQAVLTPMTYDTNGAIWKTSTPWTKNHFYRDYIRGLSGKDPLTKSFHFTSFDNPHISREAIQKDIDDNGGMNSLFVRTEIMAEFIDDVDMYFKGAMIDATSDHYEPLLTTTDMLHHVPFQKSQFVLGVDIAHLGEDSTVYIILEKRYDKDHWVVNYVEEVASNMLYEVTDHIRLLHEKYNFNSMYLDYTGLGTGPGDDLIRSHSNIVKPIRFTNQSKHDMYSNLNIQLNKKKILLPISHKKLLYQLKDLRYTKTVDKDADTGTGMIKIHHPNGGHDDFPDALALATLALKKETSGVFTLA